MSSLTAKSTTMDSSAHSTLKLLSHICFVAGFVSILASIAVWFYYSTPDPSHRERIAIFVGLWPPTFFALSDRLDRYVKSLSHRSA